MEPYRVDEYTTGDRRAADVMGPGGACAILVAPELARSIAQRCNAAYAAGRASRDDDLSRLLKWADNSGPISEGTADAIRHKICSMLENRT